MFFTNQINGKIKAIYTGRFSYVLGVDLTSALADYQKIIRERKKGTIELNEEYNHCKLFLWSIAGLYINGLRWVVRAIYMISNISCIVHDYYKARSIYFGLSYDYHEKYVGSSIKNLKELLTIDMKIIFLSLKNSRIYLLFLFLFPLIWFIGLIITYHFTVRIRDNSTEDPKEINISKHGYVGIEQNRKSNPFSKKIGQLIQLENHINRGNHVSWMMQKYYAEKEMWKKYGNLFSFGSTNTFDEYVNQYVRFVDLWFGCVMPRKYMINLMKKPEEGINIPIKYDKGLKCFAWFAYAHGN